MELDAKHEILKIIVECIESKYNVELSEKDQTNLLFNAMSKPKSGMGEIAIPCFRILKLLKQKNPKQVKNIFKKFHTILRSIFTLITI